MINLQTEARNSKQARDTKPEVRSVSNLEFIISDLFLASSFNILASRRPEGAALC